MLAMKEFEWLEENLDRMLDRVAELRREKSRLELELTSARHDMELLESENQALRIAMAREESLRQEAAARIDALMGAICREQPSSCQK